MDLTQEKLNTGDYFNYDLNDYINNAFAAADRNFTRIFEALNEIQAVLNMGTGAWVTFTGGGHTYRVGSDTDGIFKLQQALTALGFNGTESTDEGVTGDYITLMPWELGL
jgi:hypothetical protein